jgi:hypothetical protein
MHIVSKIFVMSFIVFETSFSILDPRKIAAWFTTFTKRAKGSEIWWK